MLMRVNIRVKTTLAISMMRNLEGKLTISISENMQLQLRIKQPLDNNNNNRDINKIKEKGSKWRMDHKVMQRIIISSSSIIISRMRLVARIIFNMGRVIILILIITDRCNHNTSSRST